MTAEQDDLNPAAIMAAHEGHKTDGFGNGCLGSLARWGDPPCLPYRLASLALDLQSELERIASHTRDAYDQRDAAQEALAASEAKVVRVQAVHETYYMASVDGERAIRAALADPTHTAPCPRTTPFKSYTEPTCSRPEGHAGGCLFNSHDGRTPLEVMPK